MRQQIFVFLQQIADCSTEQTTNLIPSVLNFMRDNTLAACLSPSRPVITTTTNNNNTANSNNNNNDKVNGANVMIVVDKPSDDPALSRIDSTLTNVSTEVDSLTTASDAGNSSAPLLSAQNSTSSSVWSSGAGQAMSMRSNATDNAADLADVASDQESESTERGSNTDTVTDALNTTVDSGSALNTTVDSCSVFEPSDIGGAGGGDSSMLSSVSADLGPMGAAAKKMSGATLAGKRVSFGVDVAESTDTEAEGSAATQPQASVKSPHQGGMAVCGCVCGVWVGAWVGGCGCGCCFCLCLSLSYICHSLFSSHFPTHRRQNCT
jgi:hypothetical protein